VQVPQVATPTAPTQVPQVQTPQVPTPTPVPLVISEPRKPTHSESTSVVQSEPTSVVQIEPEISDLPPLEEGSGPTSPQPVQGQPQVPDKLRDLLARTQLHNRVVTGSFGSDDLEAAAKYQATLRAKEQLAALVTKSLQIELANKQAAYRDRLASSSSSDSSAYNTPAGSPDSTPISKTKGKIRKILIKSPTL
jgi:hypothetical protein